MDQPTMFEPRGVAEDTACLTAYLPVPVFGMLPVNAFVIDAAEPVLVDTGLAMLREEFMGALRRVIDPKALRWIWLTHVDPDHLGNLAAVLAEAPNARLVTSFLGMGKLNMHGVAVERAYLLNPGQRLDVGDRELQAVAPPVFDAPETTGLLDTRTGALFSADCFGAMMDAPAGSAEEIPEGALRRGMLGWAAVDAPWLQTVDAALFGERLETVRRLQPTGIYSSHLPPAFGMADALLDILEEAPAAPLFVGPDQAALERMMSGAG